MYKIIGGDKIEYGPATADEVKGWLREGRADANTLAQFEDGTWQPLYAFPEFAELLTPPRAASAVRGRTIEELFTQDYAFNGFSCLKRGFDLVMQHWVRVLGFTLVTLTPYLALGLWISSFSDAAVEEFKKKQEVSSTGMALILLTGLLLMTLGTLFHGIVYGYYLKLVRTGRATILDGLRMMVTSAGTLLTAGFISGLMILAGACMCLAPGIYLLVGFTFIAPLVCDRRLSAGQAMLLSLKVVGKHWFSVFAFVMLIGALEFLGSLLYYGVGLVITFPIVSATLVYAYEDIFQSRTDQP